jgi:GTP-binding protein Era
LELIKGLDMSKCGFVTLVGRANVGKSALLNAIIGKKVSIVSKIPQTTRVQIRAILNESRGQIIFIDKPGFYLSKERMAKMLSSVACDIENDVDTIVYVVDLQRFPGEEEKRIAQTTKITQKPVILALNKRDLGERFASDYIEFWRRIPPEGEGELKYYLPVSALEKKGIKKLVDLLFENLKEQPLLYSPDMVCDLPQKLIVSDIIREKIFMFVLEEVPHSVAVLVEEITERSPYLVYIKATILVQRKTQRAIIIGKQGSNLKRVGQLARDELQNLFKKKVYLDIWIKVKENWLKDPLMLKQLGIIK